jgi:predicted amidohydrolase YtcJ
MMRNLDRREIVTGILASAALPRPGWAHNAPAHIILRNGRVWTGIPTQSFVQAVSIRGGLIHAVGSDREVLRGARRDTHVIDLDGRFAMPGVNDAHDHAIEAPIGTLAATERPAMADPPLAELIAALKTAVAESPPGGWLYASGGAAALSDPGGTRSAIDKAVPDHPVMIVAWWGHGVIVSTRGLKLLGVNDAGKDPPGGWLDRNSSGKLTGRLDEYAGFAAERRPVPGVPLAVRVAALRAYADRRLSEGVTSVQVMGTAQPIDMMRGTVIGADVPLRLRVIRFPIPGEEPLQAMPEQRWTPLARRSGVKYILDGTPIEQGAYQASDYRGRPGWHGRLNFDPAFIEARLRTALESGEQLALHAVGSATAGIVLDLMERLAPPERWRPLRLRLEHANGIVGGNVERAKRLGIVIAQFRPTAPVEIWQQAGIPLAFGSDGGFPPWSSLQSMVDPANPAAIGIDQALAILTAGPAFAEFSEQSKGRIAPGMAADLTVLSQDVTRVAAAQLPTTRSLLTMVAGQIAHAEAPFQ